MDKQSLSDAISKATKYAKDLKHQVSISNPQLASQNSISSELSFHELAYLNKNSIPLYFYSDKSNKAKSKAESMIFFKESSPPKMADKSMLNNTSKMSITKKQVYSENERESNLNKSQNNNRVQSKHPSSLLAGSIGSRELINKKNGHNHTYTHLNDINYDKFSEIDSKMSTKGQKINRIRHSKSPSKERHAQLNYTTFAEEPYNTSYLNSFNVPQRSKSLQKENIFQVSKLIQEINRLQQIIKKYKCLIIQIKTKYKEMQQKAKQKVINDHFIDVLKLQIEQLQEKNNSLNLIIHQQHKHINSFQSLFVQKIIKINQYYAKFTDQTIKTQKQNDMLKKMLLIATQKPHLDSAQLNGSSKDRVAYEANSAFVNISKSIEKFTQKWS